MTRAVLSGASARLRRFFLETPVLIREVSFLKSLVKYPPTVLVLQSFGSHSIGHIQPANASACSMSATLAFRNSGWYTRVFWLLVRLVKTCLTVTQPVASTNRSNNHPPTKCLTLVVHFNLSIPFLRITALYRCTLYRYPLCA